jgi:orotidine-5'-phosphate decarboxylase
VSSQLIVALDVATKKEAENVAGRLNPRDCAVKIGPVLFTRTGPLLVEQLVRQGFRVFLDLKFHDIPNTVAEACRAAADLGVWMLNVHALGGEAMLYAARRALESYGDTKPLLIAVTVLTSMGDKDVKPLGFTSVWPLVKQLAQLTQMMALDGVVCSAQEVVRIKKEVSGSLCTVTPGIRLPGDALHDQTRVVTPEDAALLGCDYIVMGRSILESPDPMVTVEKVLHMMRLL